MTWRTKFAPARRGRDRIVLVLAAWATPNW